MPIKWTYEKIAEEAKKYEMRNCFKSGNESAYNAARRLGILDKVCSHMKHLHISWTYEMIGEEAKKYKTRNEFEKGSRGAYRAAKRRNILDEVCYHMTPVRISWTYEMIAEEAKKYQSRRKFYEGSRSAYNAASRRDILDDVCSHMTPVQTHLYILEMIIGEKVIYKVGASGEVEKRINTIKRNASLEKYGEVYLLETDKCLIFEKEILTMGQPYEFERKFKGSGEIRQFDDETLKFILKKYFGVDK